MVLCEKDELDNQVHCTRHKMTKAQQYEDQLIAECAATIAAECKRWEDNACDLEEQIERETQRSHGVELRICTEIEVRFPSCRIRHFIVK